MPLPLTKFVESLPLFWKLATFRLCLYLLVVADNAWKSSIEGFSDISEMTPLQIVKMHHNVAIAVVTTIIAFLDSGISTIQKPTGLTAEDIKRILVDMGHQPGGAAVVVTETAQTTSIQTPPATPS